MCLALSVGIVFAAMCIFIVYSINVREIKSSVPNLESGILSNCGDKVELKAFLKENHVKYTEHSVQQMSEDKIRRYEVSLGAFPKKSDCLLLTSIDNRRAINTWNENHYIYYSFLFDRNGKLIKKINFKGTKTKFDY
jgi:glutaredoxin